MIIMALLCYSFDEMYDKYRLVSILDLIIVFIYVRQ